MGRFFLKRPFGKITRLPEGPGCSKLPRRIYSICKTEPVLLLGHSSLSYMKDGAFHRIPFSRCVHEVMEDSRGELWVSSGHDGLWHYRGGNLEDKLPGAVQHNPEDEFSLPSNIVTSSFEDMVSDLVTTDRRLCQRTRLPGLSDILIILLSKSPRIARACFGLLQSRSAMLQSSDRGLPSLDP